MRFFKNVKDLNWKYALGEISLIFVGITLAIWFNNWNQNKIDGNKKSEYLLNLKSDLEEDIDELTNLISSNNTRIKRIDLFNEILEDSYNPDISCDSVQKYMSSASFINVFVGSSTVFEDLQHTGNLILLDNKSLKRRVMKYYASAESRKKYEDLNSRFHINTIGTFLKKQWNTKALFGLESNDKGKIDSLTFDDCKKTIQNLVEFRNDHKIKQELKNHINFSNFIIKGNNGEYELMRAEAKALTSLIENES